MRHVSLILLAILDIAVTVPIFVLEATFAWDTQWYRHTAWPSSSRIAAPIFLGLIGAFYAAIIGTIAGEKTSRVLLLVVAGIIAAVIFYDNVPNFIFYEPDGFQSPPPSPLGLVLTVAGIAWWGLNYWILRRSRVSDQ